MERCDCKEKTVLEKGDGSFIAYESWCPKHGYYTSCYKCNPDPKAFNTELCRANHSFYDRKMMKLENKALRGGK